MNRSKLLTVAVASCTCLSVLAIEDQPVDTTKILELQNVDVVATRATDNTPVAFTNVTRAELERVNTGVDLPYMLQMTPSLMVTSDAGGGVGYTSIRVRGTDASRINVTANGIPINDSESHNVYWVNMPDLVSTLKDVQVQRGAGTSTNGGAAFGASINMQTETPAMDSYGEVNVSYGMYNTNKQNLCLGSGLLNDHWALDARLSHIGSDGYIDRASSKLWSYFGQAAYYNGSTSLKLISFGGKERTYQAWDYATLEQIDTYGRRFNPCGMYTDKDGNIAYYPDQYDNYAQYHFHMILNQGLGKNWHLNLSLHYTKGDGYYEQYKTRQKFKVYGLDPYEYDGETISRSDLVRYKNVSNGFGGGIFSLKYTKDNVSMVLGGGLNNYKGHHFGQISWIRNYVGPLDPLQEYYRNLGEKLDGNIYARATVGITKGLTAYGDLQGRYIDYKITGKGDNFDDRTGAMEHLDIHREFKFFNPKLGLDYVFRQNHRLYASFAIAHREPTRDNFIDSAPDRKPTAERMDDYELGYSFSSKIVNAGINLYYMDYKDQLVATGRLSDTGNAVSENVPKSYRMGCELFWDIRPVKWFDWQFTTTLSRNRIKDYAEYIYGDDDPIVIDHHDAPISYSPQLMLSNLFSFNLGNFDLSLQSRYVSRQYLDNTGDKDISLNPYFVSDMLMGYNFNNVLGIKQIRLGLAIYNLFNEKYESNGWAYKYYYNDDAGKPVIGYEAGYAVQAPIHVMGTVSVKF